MQDAVNGKVEGAEADGRGSLLTPTSHVAAQHTLNATLGKSHILQDVSQRTETSSTTPAGLGAQESPMAGTASSDPAAAPGATCTPDTKDTAIRAGDGFGATAGATDLLAARPDAIAQTPIASGTSRLAHVGSSAPVPRGTSAANIPARTAGQPTHTTSATRARYNRVPPNEQHQLPTDPPGLLQEDAKQERQVAPTWWLLPGSFYCAVSSDGALCNFTTGVGCRATAKGRYNVELGGRK